MAVIGKIRKHSGLIVIVVGIALAAFVLGDFLKSSPRRQNTIGEIEGEEITMLEFSQMVDAKIAREQENQQNEQLEASEYYNIRQQTWEEIIYNQLMGSEFDKLGVEVTSDELFELLQGNNPHPAVVQSFTDPSTGQFMRQQVINIIQNLNQLTPEQRSRWIDFERNVKKDQLQKKYNNLISKSYFVPETFAQKLYQEQETEAIIRLIGLKYNTVPDSLVSFTDSEVEEMYEKTKERYNQPEFVSIEYVAFDVLPSEEDYQNEKIRTDQIFENFKKTNNIPIFVRGNSDDDIDSTWYTEGQLPVTIDSIMFNSPKGKFVSPYLEDDAYHMAKLMDISYRPDSMKASHVLITYQGAFRADPNIERTTEEAEELADSLYNVIQNNPNRLDEIAKELSNGPSGPDGGDLGWFPDQTTAYNFNEAIVNGSIGEISFAETPFGFHIIKTTGKSPNVKKVRVAQINRQVRASEQTDNEIKRRAKIFSGENRTPEEFEQAIVDEALVKKAAPHVTRMMNQIPGLEYPRSIIRWAYDENVKPGTVSHVFEIDNNSKYVVVLLKERRPEGFIPLEELRGSMENMVKQEKKAEYLIEKMNSLEGNIYQMAEDLDVKVDTATVSFGSPNIKGIGREPKVISAVFTSEEGVLSPPIKGNLAVYRFVTDQFLKPAGSTNLEAYKQPLYNSFNRRVTSNAYYTAIKDKADIEDNRILFY